MPTPGSWCCCWRRWWKDSPDSSPSPHCLCLSPKRENFERQYSNTAAVWSIVRSYRVRDILRLRNATCKSCGCDFGVFANTSPVSRRNYRCAGAPGIIILVIGKRDWVDATRARGALGEWRRARAREGNKGLLARFREFQGRRGQIDLQWETVGLRGWVHDSAEKYGDRGFWFVNRGFDTARSIGLRLTWELCNFIESEKVHCGTKSEGK